jgi:hypothetical protein
MLRRHAGKRKVVPKSHLSLTLYGGEWLAPYPRYYPPQERRASTHWTGGWVGTTGSLHILEKIKVSCTIRNWTQNHPAHSLVTTTAMPSQVQVCTKQDIRSKTKESYLWYQTVHPDTSRHKEESWEQKGINKGRLWEDRRDCRFFIHCSAENRNFKKMQKK